MIAAMGFGFLTALFILGRVVRPMARISESMRAVASGDLARDIPYRDNADELGDPGPRARRLPRQRAGQAADMEEELLRSRVAKEAAEQAHACSSRSFWPI